MNPNRGRMGVDAGEAAKLQSSPDAARGTAQPEATPAVGTGCRVPGTVRSPAARGCDAANQLTQGH